jgi:DNA topoisomerase-1
MTQSLVIVESPAKCKKIESYLGPGYKVMASYGHFRTISGLDSIDIANGFTPKYSIIQEELKLKQIERIRTEITRSTDVILATDDDREGEAISWHICDLFSLPIKTTKRIIFHEITETAIKMAILNPKRINMDLVYAQQSRQILDLLVGYNISPILWNCVSKTHDASLSAGRCQTPALRLVYDNYLDIKKSPGKMVFNTTALFTNLNLTFELNKQFTNNETVKDFLEKCKIFDFEYTSTPPKKNIKKPPEPLTTSTLQQLASNELHLSPKDTMKYAQQLYEGGYITYMRTDSKKYSVEFVDKAKAYIKSKYGEQFISQGINNLIVGSKKEKDKKEKEKEKEKEKDEPKIQEAHEAIRPVNIVTQLDINELQPKAIKLYELILKITLETCMPSAQFSSISASISAPLETKFVYKAEFPIFLGWQILEKIKTDENNTYQYLESLKQNISMKPKRVDSKFTLIDLKSHYSEARLIQLLEEKGIGRPSTFASLIDKIQERKYVEKQTITGKEIECSDFALNDNNITETTCKREFGNEKNKLVILPLGILVIEFLVEKFGTFFNYEYTKEMEDELDNIANGKKEWSSLCDTCNTNLTQLTSQLQDLKKFNIVIDDEHTLIIGKYGPVVKFVDKKDKKNISFLRVKNDLDLNQLKKLSNVTLDDVIDISNFDKNAIGKYKGQDLFIKKGKYGVYAKWGNETKSLNEDFSLIPIEKIEYLNVLKFLEKDNLLDPSKPVGLLREINEHISIRTGKFGDYIFYKKPRMKKPEFLKLNGFNSDYKKCEKELIINWIKQTYNKE